ncbi:MAG: phosphoribosylaminoimidazolesuccinocarboxamide synthase [Thermodesulfobacteriota bacterium]|nr:phosphoribosylaminoimidazolesuccinocarboxamide synthase [Thermodesulfobacteriota bacterium]
MAAGAVFETHIEGLPLFNRGKVRDVYDAGEHLLIVATDRLSAFDVVMPNPIPDKGRILTRISLYWFRELADIAPNHLISGEVKDFPAVCRKYAEILAGRTMLVKKAKPLPVECIVRGYLSGSGWKEYRKTGAVCGITLPKGLTESAKLPEPIFTPSTKAEAGTHDQNISFPEVENLIGKEMAAKIAQISLRLYKKASSLAEKKGIIIADTKFEFGLTGENLMLIDEVLTPDSSRFWPQDQYQPGQGQPSFDKQFARDYLLSLHWDQKPPAPELPPEIIAKTRSKYIEAFERLTGKKFV